jgi:type IV pilus assembly protein PilC
MFPVTAVQMLRVGESTGTLDDQLEVTAQYYETELDYKIKKLTGLFEPAVIIVMGLIVGFVAVALVSAMYGVFHQVKV